MAEVHEEVGVERTCREVIDAASAVGDIAEDKAVSDAGEGFEDIRDDKGVHQKAFGELESDARCVR